VDNFNYFVSSFIFPAISDFLSFTKPIGCLDN